MRLLASTSDTLKLTTVGATEAIDVQVDYVDKDGSVITPGRQVAVQIAAAATTVICAAPLGTAIRNIKSITVSNVHATASVTVTLLRFDGTTNSRIYPAFALLAGYTLSYDDEEWNLYDASGAKVLMPLTGRWLKRTVILNGTTLFTTGPSTNSIIARMIAGGGQGGGGIATTGCNGAGGGAGSYAEWSVNVSPNTGYTCAVGLGGTTGGTGALGQTGGITTLAVGATTVTCNGGVGGAVGASISIPVLGGAGGAVSTNGTLNATGGAGGISVCTGTALNNASGKGADSCFGGGGAQKVNASAATGNAAGGFGAGGGGATTTGTATAGGAGSNGVIIVDEYS